ncbi:type II toxin-antitoxin system RelE/ParE family toxin [bacterium]|nr:type II toxin-antitoxin system RelE/ParE family toxin [bacterium]
MRYRVVISPDAENDLKESFSWYEDRRQGLGYDFLLQIDAGLRFIERNPKIFPPEYKGARKYLVKRFPYKIIYFLEEERIIVLAVIHGKRSSILTKERIDSI